MSGSTLSPALLARLSLAARSAVESCGGVDGAAATTGRGRSTAGRWMNRNEPDQPPVDAALAMDLAVVLQGKAPPITSAMAAELGFALLRLPEGVCGSGEWHEAMGRLAGEVGDVMNRICSALADDNAVSAADVRRLNIVGEIDEAVQQLMTLRQLAVATIDGGAA